MAHPEQKSGQVLVRTPMSSWRGIIANFQSHVMSTEVRPAVRFCAQSNALFQKVINVTGLSSRANRRTEPAQGGHGAGYYRGLIGIAKSGQFSVRTSSEKARDFSGVRGTMSGDLKSVFNVYCRVNKQISARGNWPATEKNYDGRSHVPTSLVLGLAPRFLGSSSRRGSVCFCPHTFNRLP